MIISLSAKGTEPATINPDPELVKAGDNVIWELDFAPVGALNAIEWTIYFSQASLLRRLVLRRIYPNGKSKYGGMEVGEAQRLRSLEDENRQLKHSVADLSLNNEVKADVAFAMEQFAMSERRACWLVELEMLRILILTTDTVTTGAGQTPAYPSVPRELNLRKTTC